MYSSQSEEQGGIILVSSTTFIELEVSFVVDWRYVVGAQFAMRRETRRK